MLMTRHPCPTGLKIEKKESELYAPIKRFLEKQGYEVKGEIKDCDILAVRGSEDPIVVELKLTFNLDVLLQAVNRLSLSPVVYIGIPSSCRAYRKRRRHILKILRMLGIGLILVGPRHDQVETVLDPVEYRPRINRQRRAQLLGEFQRRQGDPMPGGSGRRRGMMTAYRQRALRLAQYLAEHGPAKASVLAHNLAISEARLILYRNVYGWFDRLGMGIYQLSPQGKADLSLWSGDFPLSEMGE